MSKTIPSKPDFNALSKALDDSKDVKKEPVLDEEISLELAVSDKLKGNFKAIIPGEAPKEVGNSIEAKPHPPIVLPDDGLGTELGKDREILVYGSVKAKPSEFVEIDKSLDSLIKLPAKTDIDISFSYRKKPIPSKPVSPNPNIKYGITDYAIGVEIKKLTVLKDWFTFNEAYLGFSRTSGLHRYSIKTKASFKNYLNVYGALEIQEQARPKSPVKNGKNNAPIPPPAFYNKQFILELDEEKHDTDNPLEIGTLAKKVYGQLDADLVSKLNDFKLASLVLSGDMTQEQESFYFLIDVQSTWSPIDLFELSEVKVAFKHTKYLPPKNTSTGNTVTKPIPDPSLEVYFLGKCKIGDVPLEALCEYKDVEVEQKKFKQLHFSASTEEDSDIPVGKLVGYLAGKVGVGADIIPDSISGLKVTHVEVEAKIDQPQAPKLPVATEGTVVKPPKTPVTKAQNNYDFSFQLAVENDTEGKASWNPIEALVLSDLSLSVHYNSRPVAVVSNPTNPEDEGTGGAGGPINTPTVAKRSHDLEIDLHAGFYIGTYQFVADFEYQELNGEIQLDMSAKTVPDQHIEIGEFIKQVVHTFGGNATLPDAIGDMEITDIEFESQIKEPKQSAQAIAQKKPLASSYSASFKIKGHTNIAGKEIDLSIELSLDKKPDLKGNIHTSYAFGAILDIEGHEFVFDFEKDDVESVILGAYINEEGDDIELSTLLKPIDVQNLPIDLSFVLKKALIARIQEAQKPKTAAGSNAIPVKSSGSTGGKSNQQDQKIAANYLLGVYFDIPVNLSNVPLVGHFLPDDLDIGLKDVQLLYAKDQVNGDTLAKINKQIKEEAAEIITLDQEEEDGSKTDGRPLQKEIEEEAEETVVDSSSKDKGLGAEKETPEEGKKAPQKEDASDGINKGLTFRGSLKLDSLLTIPLNASMSQNEEAEGSGTDEAQPPSPKEAAPSKPDALRKLGTHIGPILFNKASLKFQDGKIGLEVDGGLSLASFEFELLGLEVDVPMEVLSDISKIKDIDFGLRGFAAHIQDPGFSISGAFLHQKIEVEGKPTDEYNGLLQVEMEQFSLTGMGSYAQFDGHTSLFAFVAIGFPIAVSPALLFEGFSLGFGIHRDFIAPQQGHLLEFPLMELSVTPPPQDLDIADLAESMNTYFPPKADEFFVVAGVTFTAFGIVDTTAMFSVKFGHDLEIDLMGISSVGYPSFLLELEWSGKVVPSQGYFYFGGQTTDRSYVYVPQARLTGAFAVASWTKNINFKGDEVNAGDYVVSIGGYHPLYKKPKHYPGHLARLGINFKSGPADISAGVYFAITPHVLMTGAFMKASVNKGPLFAYISMTLDAIINYEPFHYDILMHCDAGVRVTIPLPWPLSDLHFDKHIDIDVHAWGPDFAGTASIDVGPKTFHLDFGDTGSKNTPVPIDLNTFKNKFLHSTFDKSGKEEENLKVVTGTITKGVLRKVKLKDDSIKYLVNPKELEIEVKSLIPLALGTTSEIGVGPMDLKSGGFSCDLSITYDASDSKTPHFESGTYTKEGLFETDKYTTQYVPKAVWGSGFPTASNPLSDEGSLIKANVGKVVKLLPPDEKQETKDFPRKSFSFNDDQGKVHNGSIPTEIKKVQMSDETSIPLWVNDFVGLSSESISPIKTNHFLANPLSTKLTQA